jgi:hypothetical protein
MADFWPLFSDDVVTDDDDDGQPNARTSAIATDDAFDDHHGHGGAVGSFDDELVRANIHFECFFGFGFGWRGTRRDAGAIDRVRVRTLKAFGVFFRRGPIGVNACANERNDAWCEIDSISF